tara:strand:- start:2461 stop:2985 length:525 start_codon:yes stop_codon:yes gene_type:complete
MKEEIYKDIPNYNGAYQVSNQGNVRSKNRQIKGAYGKYVKKGRILKQGLNAQDFLKVNLHKEGVAETRLVHSLVAEAFLGHVKTGHGARVIHLNRDKWNNNVENLKVISNLSSIYTTRKGTSSKYIGVCFDKFNNSWKASLFYDGKQRNLGLFKTEVEAMQCYQKKLQEVLNNS